MQIKINKEVKDYTESIFFGLSLRQCIFSLLACIVAVGIYFITIEYLGLETTSWLCILGAAPFAALGFITYQSMNAEEIIISLMRSFLLSHSKLISKPYNMYYEIYKELTERKKKEEVLVNVKKLFKVKESK